LSATRA
jgi:hypothetical protein